MTQLRTALELAVLPLVLAVPPIHGQEAAVRPEFEVASIRINTECDKNTGAGARDPTPGNFSVHCMSLKNLIQFAFGYFADGEAEGAPIRNIAGIPHVIESDRYDVTAKAANAAPFERMAGPMLRGLLEDRFKLKAHTEVRKAPVYALTVAKGGPKLNPTKEGSCIILDLNHLSPRPERGKPFPTFCGHPTTSIKGSNLTLEGSGVTAEELCRALSGRLDRTVINRTGLAGKYDIHLQYAALESSLSGTSVLGVPPDSGNSVPIDSGPSIFTALPEQLGLKLVSDKGPVEFLVIDHVERPSEN